MGAVSLAIDLLGIEKVDPGSWMRPFYVEATSDDVGALVGLLTELDNGIPYRAVKDAVVA